MAIPTLSANINWAHVQIALVATFLNRLSKFELSGVAKIPTVHLLTNFGHLVRHLSLDEVGRSKNHRAHFAANRKQDKSRNCSNSLWSLKFQPLNAIFDTFYYVALDKTSWSVSNKVSSVDCCQCYWNFYKAAAILMLLPPCAGKEFRWSKSKTCRSRSRSQVKIMILDFYLVPSVARYLVRSGKWILTTSEDSNFENRFRMMAAWAPWKNVVGFF